MLLFKYKWSFKRKDNSLDVLDFLSPAEDIGLALSVHPSARLSFRSSFRPKS